MRKKILRWAAGFFITLFLLAIVAVLSLDRIARTMAERRIESETGFHTFIKNFTVGLSAPIIHIENFVLKNPSQFGGDVKAYFDNHLAIGSGDLLVAIVGMLVAFLYVRFLYQRKIFLRL